MRTIQEKYNAVLEGNFSKTNFLRDAKRELSQFLSPFNGFPDTIAILKAKGVLVEAKVEKTLQYNPPAVGVSLEAQQRGIDYELEAMGLMSNDTVTEKDYDKACKKALKNLNKNPMHYLNLIAGESKKVNKHDQMVPVNKKNSKDTFNQMKKAQLKEEVDARLDPYEDKNVILKQVMALLVREKGASREELKGFINTHMEDILNAPDDAAIVDEFEQYISVNNDYVDEKKGKNLSEEYKPGSTAPVDLYYSDKHGRLVAKDDVDDKYHASLELVYKKGDKIEGPMDEKKGKDHDGDGDIDGDDYMMAKDKAIKGAKSEAIGGPDHQKLEDLGYSAGEKALMSIDDKIFNHPNFDSFVGGFMKGFKDHLEASQDYALHSVNEGRRRKMKGGKVVTENDYETGGYVESMGPMLDKILKQLISVWDEWKDGPATEPAMVPFAKKDLVSYIDSKIVEGEDIVEDYKPSHRAYNVIDGKGNIVYKELPRHTAIEKASEREDYGFVATDSLAEDSIEEHQELKEAFKAIISKVLQEEVITEAATGNLAKIASQYSDFEGMQAAVNDLENVVTDIESYYAKTKEKIQKVYDSFRDIKNAEGLAVGAMLGPAIEAAFKKDLIPVKGFTSGLEMPKVKMLETDEIAEEELDEKETVFKPINEKVAAEGKKYKYSKKK